MRGIRICSNCVNYVKLKIQYEPIAIENSNFFTLPCDGMNNLSGLFGNIPLISSNVYITNDIIVDFRDTLENRFGRINYFD